MAHGQAMVGRSGALGRGQQDRQDTHQGQERTQLIDVLDTVGIREQTEQRCANPAEPEHQAEEDPGDHAHVSRHQFLGVHHDGREGRRDDEPDHHAQHCRPEQVDVGQGQGERRGTQDGEPDDFLAPDFVAIGPPRKGAKGPGAGEQEKLHLGAGNRQPNFLDKEKREVAGRVVH